MTILFLVYVQKMRSRIFSHSAFFYQNSFLDVRSFLDPFQRMLLSRIESCLFSNLSNIRKQLPWVMSSFNTTIYCVPLKYSMFNPIISLYCLLFALVLLDSYTTNHLFQLPFCVLRTFLYITRIYDKMMTKTFLQVDESAVTLFFFVAVFFSQLWFKKRV